MAEFLAERYEPGETAEQADRAALRLAVAVCELREEGHDIHFLDATFVPGDEASLTRFHAASPELVAAAHERVGVRVDRIVEVIEFGAVRERRAAAAGRRPPGGAHGDRRQFGSAAADQQSVDTSSPATTREDRS